MQSTDEIQALLDKYLSDQMTKVDRIRFMNLIQDTSNQQELTSIIEVVLQQQRYKTAFDVDKEALFRQIMQKAQAMAATPVALPSVTAGLQSAEDTPVSSTPVHSIHFVKTAWFRYAAAVVLTLGLATVAYLWTTNKKPDKTLVNSSKQIQTDISPGGEKAVLTLADGSKILLDSAANGKLVNQGGVQIIKLANGQIAYDLRGLNSKEVIWNTLSTPKGGQYQVTLSDGTGVWLNASSSITFPTTFAGAQRAVEIEGEVYFEVARNKEKPFIIDVGGKSTIKVLGTSFNVNSYADEGSIKTTLLKGSVRVSNSATKASAVLRPGQQAQISTTPFSASSDQQPHHSGTDGQRSIAVVSNADIEQALAWKNGWFDFNGANLYDVMRQLERWYDIDVKYEGRIPEVTFKGKMDKGVTLSGMLNIFSNLNFEIKTRLEGRTLIVSGT